MKNATWLFIPFLLAGCATTPPPEPIVHTVTKEVPVVQKCDARSKIGPPVAHVDTDSALQTAKNLFERVKLLMAGREERTAREKLLEGAVDACSR